MKKIGVFLWLMVLAFANYTGYDLWQKTYFKKQDIEVVNQQNLALRITTELMQESVRGRVEFLIALSSKQGGSKKIEEDIMKIELLDSITYSIGYQLDSLFKENVNTTNQSITNRILPLFHSFSQVVFPKDTDFVPTIHPIVVCTDLCSVFRKQYVLCLQSHLWKTTEKLAEKHSAYLTTVTIKFPSYYRVICPKKVFHSKEFYEANILTINEIIDNKQMKMYINNGQIKQQPYNIGEISMQSHKVSKYPEAKRVQITGKIVVKNNHNKDTTITVSMNYKIKPKQEK